MKIHTRIRTRTNTVSRSTSPHGLTLLTLASAVAAFGCGVSGSGGPTGGTGSGTAGSSASGTAGSGTAGTSGGGSGAAASGSGSAGTGAAGSSTSGSGTGTAGDTGTAGTGSSGTAGGGSSGTAGSLGSSGAGGTGAAGTGTPSGVTINIGGTMVAKENAIAFIHIGHSNMAGRGVDLPATRPYFFGTPDPHAWMYHSGTGFEPAVEPKTAGDGENMLNGMVSGGPGTALVKEAAALAPGKTFISLGFGQSSAYCSQFLPGALYYDKLIAGPKELKGKVTFAGIMIYLGITERHGTTADVNNFPQCINQLVTAIRKDVGEPNLPMMINDYEMGTTGPLAVGSSFYNAIHPKILMVPTVVANSALIPTDGVAIQDDHSTTDDHHFTLDGHKEYVRRMLMTMQQKGWFPWQ
jgi:hypothetical protein